MCVRFMVHELQALNAHDRARPCAQAQAKQSMRRVLPLSAKREQLPHLATRPSAVAMVELPHEWLLQGRSRERQVLEALSKHTAHRGVGNSDAVQE